MNGGEREPKTKEEEKEDEDEDEMQVATLICFQNKICVVFYLFFLFLLFHFITTLVPLFCHFFLLCFFAARRIHRTSVAVCL